MKSQVALEYLMVISFALMVLVPYTLYLQTVSQNLKDDNNLLVASSSVQKIGQMSDWVFSQGEPAKVTILLQIPNNVEEISFNGKMMKWRVRTSSGVSDIYYFSTANLTGNLSTNPGYYYVSIQAMKDGVNVSVSSS
ncbi:MAG: hypothetical protein QXG39_02990 [Candidatus Aenigmatarchaeota archaeon]